jgi:hypothetical protein
MSELKKIYVLTNREQLIDLNDVTVNFDIWFKVESTNKKDFMAAIIDQNLLDENNYEYKSSINGEFEGQVIANKNKDFINYYLILKSIDNEPCEVAVTLKKEIIENLDEENLDEENLDGKNLDEENNSFNLLSILKKNWKYILVFIILTTLFLFFNKKQEKLQNKINETNSTYSPSNHSVYSPSNHSVSNSSVYSVSNSSVYSQSNSGGSNSSVYSQSNSGGSNSSVYSQSNSGGSNSSVYSPSNSIISLSNESSNESSN